MICLPAIRPAVIAAVLSLSLFPFGAPAQVLADPDTVQTMLETYGLKVKRGTDQAGGAMLSSRIEGTNFDVLFYGCQPQGSCDSIQFSTSFDLPNGLDAAQVNGWNRDRRYGKAYLDDQGDPILEYDINLDADGVGPKNFDSSIEIWRAVMADFRQYIGW